MLRYKITVKRHNSSFTQMDLYKTRILYNLFQAKTRGNLENSNSTYSKINSAGAMAESADAMDFNNLSTRVGNSLCEFGQTRGSLR